MKIITKRTSVGDIHKHETKQHVLLKFSAVVVFVLGYFFFVSYKYGAENGLLVTFLTWSFFVLSTPIADAGFLIDFPVRLITRIKMFYSEIIVWIIAIGINIYALQLRPELYELTDLLKIFKTILVKPFPFWGIIFISAIGTFVSVYFGDELIDKVKHNERKFYHKHKYNYQFIIMIFIFGISFVLYTFLLQKLGISFSL